MDRWLICLLVKLKISSFRLYSLTFLYELRHKYQQAFSSCWLNRLRACLRVAFSFNFVELSEFCWRQCRWTIFYFQRRHHHCTPFNDKQWHFGLTSLWLSVFVWLTNWLIAWLNTWSEHFSLYHTCGEFFVVVYPYHCNLMHSNCAFITYL